MLLVQFLFFQELFGQESVAYICLLWILYFKILLFPFMSLGRDRTPKLRLRVTGAELLKRAEQVAISCVRFENRLKMSLTLTGPPRGPAIPGSPGAPPSP